MEIPNKMKVYLDGFMVAEVMSNKLDGKERNFEGRRNVGSERNRPVLE